MANGALTPDSESDLSEAIDIPIASTSFSTSEQYDAGEESRLQESDIESSQDEDALGSDDPDYTMATPPVGNLTSDRNARSSSQDSPRQRKRKAGVEPDNYMLHDPELYGLRRSVGLDPSVLIAPLIGYCQGRPRPSRQIVWTPFSSLGDCDSLIMCIRSMTIPTMTTLDRMSEAVLHVNDRSTTSLVQVG